MSEFRKAAAASREALQFTADTLKAMRKSAVDAFEATEAADDVGRLAAWAELRAVNKLKRRLKGPLDNLQIQEASQKGSTSHD